MKPRTATRKTTLKKSVAPTVHTRPSLLPLLIMSAFCMGLLLPVFILWACIISNDSPIVVTQPAPQTLIKTPAVPVAVPPANTYRPASIPPISNGHSADYPPVIQIGSTLLKGSWVETKEPESIGSDLGEVSITEAFKSALIESPSCDTFKYEYLYKDSLLSDFWDSEAEYAYALWGLPYKQTHCFVTGSQSRFLIGVAGIQGVYEGLSEPGQVIIAVYPETREVALYYGELTNLKPVDQQLRETLWEKYDTEFAAPGWEDLMEEYTSTLETYLQHSPSAQQDKETLNQGLLDAIGFAGKPYIIEHKLNDWATGVFFVNTQGELSILDVDGEYYHDSYLSPDGNWIAYTGAAGEGRFLYLYNTQDGQHFGAEGPHGLYSETHDGDEWAKITWLTDKRLRIDDNVCYEYAKPEDPLNEQMKAIPCGPFESVSAAEPWRMKEVAE